MNRLYVLLLLFLLGITTALAQRPVRGVVVDSLTGRPLAGASVVADYTPALSGTSTDAEGRYELKLTGGKHILVVRYVGYAPFRKVFVLEDDEVINVALRPVERFLEEVVVTSKGYDRTVRQPLLGVSQLSVATLRKLPAALGEMDLLRGIQMLPGVTSVGEAANGVNIRGGTTDQNLILLDDTPIFNPTHMFGLFSVFPPDAVGGLDLYKGNVPARYGGRTASVLDITLKNPSLNGFRLSGGLGPVSARLTADLPVVPNRLGVLVSARGAFADFLLPLVSRRLNNIRAQFGDGVAKAFWRINDRNTLTAMGYYSYDFFQTPLLGNLPNVTGTTTQYAHETANAMARWFSTLSPRLNLQTSVIYAHYVPRILVPEFESTNTVTLRQSLTQRQVKSDLNYQLTNHKLEGGLSAIHYRVEPGALLPGRSESVNPVSTPTENALELAAHVDDEMALGPDLALSVGLRYAQFLAMGPATVRQYAPGEPVDDFSVVDSVRYGRGQITQGYGGFEPRFGLRYALGPDASIKFGYNLMRQYLQVVTNTTTPLPTSRWKTADTHIRPQVSQLLSAGYFRNLKENTYELSLEAYFRTTQNVVDYKPGADFLLQQYPETQLLQGRSRAYGVEWMLAKKKGELTGWVNYTYARTFNQVNEGVGIRERINGGNWYRANYDRPHTLNASININVDKHNSFSFTFALSSGRPYTAPEGFVIDQGRPYPYYATRNGARLPTYHRLDFAWNIYNPSMRDRRWRGHWVFTMYNLYARRNVYSVYFRTENERTQAYRLQIFASVVPTLTYNFEFH